MNAGDAAIYISILILLSIACLFTITGIIMLLSIYLFVYLFSVAYPDPIPEEI
jgi:hypothetical protein